jgi:hypothetical protein
VRYVFARGAALRAVQKSERAALAHIQKTAFGGRDVGFFQPPERDKCIQSQLLLNVLTCCGERVPAGLAHSHTLYALRFLVPSGASATRSIESR